MKALVLNPKDVIAWQPESRHKRFIDRAFEEKGKNTPLETLLAEAQLAVEFKDWQFLREWIYSEQCERNRRLYGVKNWELGMGWRLVPPVPVVEAPKDLRCFWEYVIFNGHHRRTAALRAGIMLPCVMLEGDKGIEYLAYNDELSRCDFGRGMNDLKEDTWYTARYYLKGRRE